MNDAAANRPSNPERTITEPGQARHGRGAELGALREQNGWSVEEVAGHLNLAPRQVRAIENDDYAALPPVAVTRGFIRGYCKLLKVDPAPYLPEMPGKMTIPTSSPATRAALSTPFSDAHLLFRSGRRAAWWKPVAAVAVLVLLAMLVFAGWQAGSFSGLSERAEDPVEENGMRVEQPEEGVAQLVLPPPVGVGQADAGPAVTAAPVEQPVQAAPPAVPETAGPTAATPAADTAGSAAGQSAAGKDLLVVKLREDSWIEIRRADKTVVVARLMKAGTEYSYEVTGPFSLVIGNVKGVDASLRGKPLEIKTRDNVARLTLK